MSQETTVRTTTLGPELQVGGEELHDYLPRLARVTVISDHKDMFSGYDTREQSPARQDTNVLGPAYVQERFGFGGFISRIILHGGHTYGELVVHGEIAPIVNPLAENDKRQPPFIYVAQRVRSDGTVEDVFLDQGVALVRLDGDDPKITPFPYMSQNAGYSSEMVVDGEGNVITDSLWHIPRPEAGFQITAHWPYDSSRLNSRGQPPISLRVGFLGGEPVRIVERWFSLLDYGRAVWRPR